MATTSDPKHPPMGVADELLGTALDSADRFRFWLFAGSDTELGARFWRTVVLRERALPPDAELKFEAGELLTG